MSASPNRARVLVVDDDEDIRDALTIELEDRGYDVRAVDSGSEAIAVAAEWGPEIVVLDIGMPGMDGYEVARRLRDEHSRSIKIIACTGFPRNTYLERALESGFDAYLTKGTPKLLDEIESLIESDPPTDPA